MVIIDAGHGGFDPGGGSNSYFKEKDLALKISTYQKRRFNELGIDSILVRSYDETLPPNERLERINSLNPKTSDILISNHINTGGDVGGEVIYSLRGNNILPQKIANELEKAGLPIRNVYQKAGKTKKDYYFILRGTTPNNAMIVEYGFSDNVADTNRLLYNWVELAEGVVKAVSEFLNVAYSTPSQKLYIVKKGDTLYNIAKKGGKSVEEIKLKNNLVSDTIFPRMELLI